MPCKSKKFFIKNRVSLISQLILSARYWRVPSFFLSPLIPPNTKNEEAAGSKKEDPQKLLLLLFDFLYVISDFRMIRNPVSSYQ